MSLDLKKYRTAHHDRLAVGGSYTDSFLEVMSDSPTSSNTLAYVRWVPNDKGGSGYYSGTDTQYLATKGYNQISFSINAMYLLRFKYFDDTATYDGSSTSPGIRLVAVNGYEASESGADEMATMLTSIHEDAYGDSIYVIVTKGQVASSTSLNNILTGGSKSWRWSLTKAASTTATDHTYTAVGTNINDIGFLSESLMGPGSLHSAAMSELVIEHSKNTLGHAGYGEDLASGLGNGSTYIDAGNYSSAQTYTRHINWANNNRFHASQDEYVRVTWEQRIGQGGRAYGASCKVTAREEKISDGTQIGSVVDNTSGYRSQTIDGWHKQELLFARQSAGTDTRLEIEIRAYKGSGTGTGFIPNDQGFHRIDVKNMQIFKCGFNPDAQRDAASHKYHINGLNIEESPGPFRIGEPTEFEAFWKSDRNLAGDTTLYDLETTNSSTSSSPMRPINYQYKNGSSQSWGDPQGYYNYPQWFDNTLNSSTGDRQTWGWVHEVYNATVNDTYDTYIGPSSGISVDHTKVYLAGIWMRVRRNSHTNSTLAPNRISMIAGTQNPGAFISSYGTTSTLLAAGTNYQQSIYANNFAFTDYTAGSNPGKMEWKLLSGFYLPSWMTATERAEWKDDYWGTWAGHFEHGDGASADVNMSGLTGYGLNTANAGYVAGMQNTTTSIRPIIRVEQYQSTDLWCEFAYPFVVEIDPMNINDEGNIYFWDFQENMPS